MMTRPQQRQRRSRVVCARAGRGWRAGTLSLRLLCPPSPQDQPERLADLGVKFVPAPEPGQRGARHVLQTETGPLGSGHFASRARP
jgi:hypothetical protein